MRATIATRSGNKATGDCPLCSTEVSVGLVDRNHSCNNCGLPFGIKPYLNGFLFVLKPTWDPNQPPSGKTISIEEWEGY